MFCKYCNKSEFQHLRVYVRAEGRHALYCRDSWGTREFSADIPAQPFPVKP